MSERRMFSKAVIESDAFLDLPYCAQALYIHLSLNADDEGFVNSSRRICGMCGATDKDLKILIDKKFLIRFDSGICVIKHWKLNNKLRSDRVKQTNYPKEKALLAEKENGIYSLHNSEVDAEKKSGDTETFAEHYDCLPHEKGNPVVKENLTTEKTSEEIERQEQLEYEAQAEPRKDYAETIFDIIFTANLPCRAKNIINFSMGDFRLGLAELTDLHLSSDDVIQSLKNYVEVIKLKRAGLSWWTTEQDFYSFCKSKTILKFAPGNFKIEKYMKNAEHMSEEDKIQL